MTSVGLAATLLPLGSTTYNDNRRHISMELQMYIKFKPKLGQICRTKQGIQKRMQLCLHDN
jgi:hypothetical protein